ncbi:MAG: hypothetical protein ACLFWF_05425 [Alphaproteobacteria bacterium]
MRQEQALPGVPGARYRGMEEAEGGNPSSRTFGFGPLIRIALGLVIAVDISLLAAPLYYGTPSPCHMVALSKASMHSGAVDEEIGINNEMSYDVYHVSSVWVRSNTSIAACAGEIGGRTLGALVP